MNRDLKIVIGDDGMRLTEDEVARARGVNLVEVLPTWGVDLIREGSQYRVKGYQGLIVSDKGWKRFSTGQGGDSIRFLVEIMGLPFRDAVMMLLGTGDIHMARTAVMSRTRSRDGFTGPPPSASCDRVILYLVSERRLPEVLVRGLISCGLVYEDHQANAAFVCKDKYDIPRSVCLRGTRGSFKGLAKGSDSRYGWVWHHGGERVATAAVVTESPIDVISVEVMCSSFGAAYSLSLNGLREGALTTFLDDHPEVGVIFLCLDSDEAGQLAAHRLETALRARSSECFIIAVPDGRKDWNDALRAYAHSSNPEMLH